MEHYAGLDVSLELTSVCIVDAQGGIVRETKIASEPEVLVHYLQTQELEIGRVGSKLGRCRSGSMPVWLAPASTRCCWRRGM